MTYKVIISQEVVVQCDTIEEGIDVLYKCFREDHPAKLVTADEQVTLAKT